MSNILVEISPGRFLFSFSFRFISNAAIEHTLDDNDMGLFNVYYFNYSKFYWCVERVASIRLVVRLKSLNKKKYYIIFIRFCILFEKRVVLFFFSLSGNFKAIFRRFSCFIFVNYNYYGKRASERRKVNKYSKRKKRPKRLYRSYVCALTRNLHPYVYNFLDEKYGSVWRSRKRIWALYKIIQANMYYVIGGLYGKI